MLNRHMIKDSGHSSRGSVISKDSQPYDDDIQSLQSKIHLVKGVGSLTVQKARQSKIGHTQGTDGTFVQNLGATHTTFNKT